MANHNRVFSAEPLTNPAGQSRRWLERATKGSVALGLAETAFGLITGSNALLGNAVGLLDNTTYGFDALAAKHNYDRKKNHQLRRAAGAIICLASLGVGAKASYDLYNHESPEVNLPEAGFAVAATGLNLSFAIGLKKDAFKGTEHRDAFRHACIDTFSSLATTGSVIATTGIAGLQGHPIIDGCTGVALCAGTIISTFPTNKRIFSADQVFIDKTNSLEPADS
jgi:divalent metal cation (Fe/Co/Zn/Cd) transporter